MSAPSQPLAAAVGVALAPCFERRGDSLADARAFEAAGCTSLWFEGGREGKEDAWLAAAAVAGVTSRARLIVPVVADDLSAPGFARRVATLQRLAGGRLDLCCAAALLPALREFVPGHVLCAVDDLAAAPADVDALVVPLAALPAEAAADARAATLWVRCDSPTDRPHWRELRARCQRLGAAGILVAQTPRLLDLLRNPDQEGDRSDLLLAHG